MHTFKIHTAFCLRDVTRAGDQVDDWLPAHLRHLLYARTASPQVTDAGAKLPELTAANNNAT